MEQTKNKKTGIRWIFLAVIVILLAGLVYWQWNNIMALRYALEYTPEQQAQMEQETEEVIKSISDEVSGVDFDALPEEAMNMLKEGELSEEEAVEVLTGRSTWEQMRQRKSSGGTASGNGSAGEQSSKVDSIIARVYVLRSSYTGKLDSLVAQAKADYRAKRGTKAELSTKYMGIGTALEGECDAQMEGLLSELQTELQRTGGDLSLVSKIRAAYQREKSLKKAALISKYKK